MNDATLPKKKTARRPMRVFLVENHPDSRLLLTMLLEVLGYEMRSVWKGGPPLHDLQFELE